MNTLTGNTSSPTQAALTWCRAALMATLAAGAFDAVYFFNNAAIKGQALVRPLHNIAAFWLGNASFAGGAFSAALGVVTHFGLALLMVSIYAFIAARCRAVVERPVVFGPMYGLSLYLAMYYVVMAIRWPTLFPRFDGWNSIIAIIVHLVFGLIIACVIASLAPRYRTREQL